MKSIFFLDIIFDFYSKYTRLTNDQKNILKLENNVNIKQ